jgi:hypothetical protein
LLIATLHLPHRAAVYLVLSWRAGGGGSSSVHQLYRSTSIRIWIRRMLFFWCGEYLAAFAAQTASSAGA